MTEQEFFRQIWHAYDTVEITGGIKGSVVNVCFPTRLVKVAISKDIQEWFKCDMIEKHTSKAGYADDNNVVEGLHNQIMRLANALDKSNENVAKKQMEIEVLKKQFTIDSYLGLKTAINRLAETLVVKQKMIDKTNECYNSVMKIINNMEENKSE